MNGQSPVTRTRTDTFTTSSNLSQPPMITSATSFTSANFNLPTAASIPRSFFDDDTVPPLTWSRLVSNMKKAIDRYREAITNGSRSEYVARAEDISDHLRLLLAAGSGTTDNHSGQPSIISTNKALYPHFRDMMSKFSKLVISSHIAAADWPNAESVQKCLQEADGVLLGVFSYVEVARQQRGEEIPVCSLVSSSARISVEAGKTTTSGLEIPSHRTSLKMKKAWWSRPPCWMASSWRGWTS